MCKKYGYSTLRFLYSKVTYIGYLPIKHTVTNLVDFCLIDDLIGFYSVLVTNPKGGSNEYQ